LIVSVNRSSSSWPLLQRYRAFTVNILGAEQLGVADKRICRTTGDCPWKPGGVVFAAEE
jgi:flavin reductase (DIM6/NTAB) family NADH-FMN oxidoreductase RutF